MCRADYDTGTSLVIPKTYISVHTVYQDGTSGSIHILYVYVSSKGGLAIKAGRLQNRWQHVYCPTVELYAVCIYTYTTSSPTNGVL